MTGPFIEGCFKPVPGEFEPWYVTLSDRETNQLLSAVLRPVLRGTPAVRGALQGEGRILSADLPQTKALDRIEGVPKMIGTNSLGGRAGRKSLPTCASNSPINSQKASRQYAQHLPAFQPQQKGLFLPMRVRRCRLLSRSASNHARTIPWPVLWHPICKDPRLSDIQRWVRVRERIVKKRTKALLATNRLAGRSTKSDGDRPGVIVDRWLGPLLLKLTPKRNGALETKRWQKS